MRIAYSNAVGTVAAVLCMSGCYNPSSFRSNGADILTQPDMWSSPQYTIIFSGIAGSGVVEQCYGFANPPSDSMLVGINVVDSSETDVLAGAGCRIRIRIVDRATHSVVFSVDGTIDARESSGADERWAKVGVIAVEPPNDWCDNQKGQVVREISWIESSDWSYARRGAVLAASRTRVRLTSQDYAITVQVELSNSLDRSVRVYPVLVGGFRTAL